MTKPKTRWDICERCMLNMKRRFVREKLLVTIEKLKGGKWQNPCRVGVFDPLMIRPRTEICGDCMFSLEHAILDQELQND